MGISGICDASVAYSVILYDEKAGLIMNAYLLWGIFGLIGASVLSVLLYSIRQYSLRLKIFLIILIPILSLAFYFYLGAPHSFEDPPLPYPQDLYDSIDRLEHKLKTKKLKGDDIRSMIVLAEFFHKVEEYELSQKWYRHALMYDPDNFDLKINAAEVDIFIQDGRISIEQMNEFEKMREAGFEHPKLSYYYAVGLAQFGHYQEALVVIKDLIAHSTVDAPWLSDAVLVLKNICHELGLDFKDHVPKPLLMPTE